MAEKMLNIQKSATQNAQELQDFLKDLNDWEGDIKNKDEKLKTAPVEEKKLPPVRGSGKKNPEGQNQKLKEAENGKTTNAKTAALSEEVPAKKRKPLPRDYRAWDKVNVDKMLEELEAEEEEKPMTIQAKADSSSNPLCSVSSESSDHDTSDDEEMDEIKLKQKANYEKEKGNTFFKSGTYDKAIECYTRGIQADPNNAILLANRAMALLKQDKFGAAESDCTAALDLDPSYVKALMRRGTARIGTGKLEDAKTDFDDVLFLEPNNKQAHNELVKVRKLIDKKGFAKSAGGAGWKEDGARDMTGDSEKRTSSRWVVPIQKPPEKRSKTTRVKVEIEEVGLTREEVEKKRKMEEKSQTRLNQMTDKDLKFFRGIGEEQEADIELDLGTVRSERKTPKIEVIGKKPAKKGKDKEERKSQIEEIESTKHGDKDVGKIVILENVTEKNKNGSISEEKADKMKMVRNVEDVDGDNPLQESRISQSKTKSPSQDVYWQSVAEDLDPKRPSQYVKAAKIDRNISSKETQVLPTKSTSDMISRVSKISLSSSDIPPSPTTALQLQTELLKLKETSLNSALNYLLQIPADSLPSIIKNMLDSDLLMSIIKTFSENIAECSRDISPYLLSLTRTNRFQMASMFLSPQDKKTVQELVHQLRVKGLLQEAASNEILKKYGLETC